MSISLLVFKWQPCQKNNFYFFKILTQKKNIASKIIDDKFKIRNKYQVMKNKVLKIKKIRKKKLILKMNNKILDIKK